jgi:hypothetical protein
MPTYFGTGHEPGDCDMRFDESHEGDYRIFVGAVEAPSGDGYTAALVVNRVRGLAPPNSPGKASPQREAFRDDSLACGYRWRSAEEAIHYAMNRARELIRSRSRMLAC